MAPDANGEDEDEELDDLPPRTAAQIGLRVCALTALLIRLDAEREVGKDPAGAQQLLANLTRWVKLENLTPHQSGIEREIIDTPLGALSSDETFSLGWRLEAAVMLLWAIGTVPALGPYHRPSVATEVGPLLPAFKPVEAFVMAGQRRPLEQIRRERERATLWHWRARTQMLELRGAAPFPGDTFAGVVRRTAESMRARGDLDAVCDGDFDCGGVAYRDLATWPNAASTAIERHYALNWLLGDADDWDRVTTDT